ncbi:TIM barrel protein [Rubripirellula amarantea]|uniref:Hydroxypyruvate isomerase n=1 Tax=Rubripirellula amarantea TaxID=2527999 RepID=A0A5C5WKI0_9BACT|nr:TIM barrel protein [Rubripirellula amarantea]MDA8743411.1 TIM barrel protein [Rubripirellula amarantea]TWT51296.1 Hydroxypyruvate isomerase [Rubripirellula amarantea]
MQRRELIKASFATAALSVSSGVFSKATRAADATTPKFKLGYAPHPGMFKVSAGADVLDQIRFAADQGFTAFEYNGLPAETPETQEKIGKLLDELKMQMGVFVAYGSFDRPTFARPSDDTTEEILKAMNDAVTVAKRVNAKWCTVVPGSVDQQHSEGEWNRYGGPRLAQGYQTANVIDMLRRCTEILEPHDLVMVLEPLNWYANHGGTFLQRSDQAYAICRAVNSPSCKILFDIYHQQITEGNLIPNIDACWSEIAYFQSGDNPGRKEPYTGEINYREVFKHIHQKGFEGVIGMEHGNSERGEEGEQKVIDAYRKADNF